MIVSNIKINVNYTEKQLIAKIARAAGKNEGSVVSYKIVRRSVDARDKNNVCFVMSVDVVFNDDNKRAADNTSDGLTTDIGCIGTKKFDKNTVDMRPVVVGSGPAGLFAALTLAEAGLPPLVIERGGSVDSRRRAVDFFRKTGILDTESNVQFGEGGAGTFSDGKLHTGVNDKRCRYVIEEFYKAGAPEEILWQAKPHIGTDKLAVVVKNIREKIIALGGEFWFNTCVTDIVHENGILQGVKVKKQCDSANEPCDKTENPEIEDEFVRCDKAIFAIGHSSRDTVEMLYKQGIEMEKKPFAVGVRIEHPREMIDKSRYGKFAGNKRLGAAEYKMNCKTSSGRGVYTFCMCPGGVVVAAASENGGLVVNGMSEFARDAENSNSALLVGISPDDTISYGENVLAGTEFQRKIEKAAYKLGGGDYKAPVQLYGDLANKRASVSLGDVNPSYMPGVAATDLRECLPEFVISSIAEAIGIFGKQINGFDRYDAVLTAVESRSSSPVRILRNEKMESSVAGLYPCGEGAGYAGGITSAAVDGIKCAEKIIESFWKV